MSETKIPYVPILLYDLPLQPEERLLHGIIWRALKDLVCSKPKDRRDACAYMLSDLCENTEWSFRWVCRQINLDPDKFVTHLSKFEDSIEHSPIYSMLLGR